MAKKSKSDKKLPLNQSIPAGLLAFILNATLPKKSR